jgi:hypothetical protein
VRPLGIRRRNDPAGPSAHGAVAVIQYSKVDPDARDGWLLYIKPGLDGNEPADIRAHATRDKTFPHQSTTDQFFSETEFESYRALGAHSLDRILEDEGEMGLGRFRRLFLRYHWEQSGTPPRRKPRP